MDIMIHDIDIALNLIDSKVKSINAVGGQVYTDREDYANCQLLLKTAVWLTSSQAVLLKKK